MYQCNILSMEKLAKQWEGFFDALSIEWKRLAAPIVLSNGLYYRVPYFLTTFNCFFTFLLREDENTPREDSETCAIRNGSDNDTWAGLIALGDPVDDNIRIFCQDSNDGSAGSYENYVTIGLHPETNEPYLFAYGDRRPRSFMTSFGPGGADIPMQTEEYGDYKYTDFVSDQVWKARKHARDQRMVEM